MNLSHLIYNQYFKYRSECILTTEFDFIIVHTKKKKTKKKIRIINVVCSFILK